MPRFRGGEDRGRLAAGSGIARRGPLAVLVAALALVAAIFAGVALGAEAPAGEETASVAEPSPAGLPTAQETRELLEASPPGQLGQTSGTDPQVAEELPHRSLDREEALELAEGVFGEALEDPAGVFDELEPTRFLSDNAAIVPASSLSEPAEAEARPQTGGPRYQPADRGPRYQPAGPAAPKGSVLLESTVPLRTENAEGKEEAVDLGLQSPEGSGGELRPQNPLTELAIPAHLGEGITLGGVGIELAGAPGQSSPTDVEEQYAFYPNVAQDTDLMVAPTSSGAETMTDIRSAEAPRTTSYRLSLPDGATLEDVPGGGAEVRQGARTVLVVPPPTAVAADGQSVPVTMEVEGDELSVSVAPGPATAYPILVDPNYMTETWCWSGCGNGFPGWVGSTTDEAYRPVWGAYWDPSHYGGLDLTSGFPGSAPSGTHADWSYWVPRYQQDFERYGTRPTSFIALWMAEGVLFLRENNDADYPAMVIGLLEPGTGWAPNAWVHYGGDGELSDWGNVLVNNPTSNPAIKGADENLVTYENEAEARYRNTFIGGSTVGIVDVDAPRILELKAPTAWVGGASASIGYGFEDTGLGVRYAGVRPAGEAGNHPYWGADFGCTGTAASPCPRRVTSSEAGSPSLVFDPEELPTGEDRLEVVLEDPLLEPGHMVTGNVTVKADHTGPEVALSGPLTEEESLGTQKAEYPLTIKATDGTGSDPQSGVAKVQVKVDGVSKASWNPGCTTQNCSFSATRVFKAAEYTFGPHEVEVLATDAVGDVTSETVEAEFG